MSETIRFAPRLPAPGDRLEQTIREETFMKLTTVKDGRPVKQEIKTRKTFAKEETVLAAPMGAVSALRIFLRDDTTTITTKGGDEKVADALLGKDFVLEQTERGLVVTMASGEPALLHEENQMRARFATALERFGALQRTLPTVELHPGDRLEGVARGIAETLQRILPKATLTGGEAVLRSIARDGVEQLGTVDFTINMNQVGNPVIVNVQLTGAAVIRESDGAALSMDMKGVLTVVDSRKPNRLGLQGTHGKGTMTAEVRFGNGSATPPPSRPSLPPLSGRMTRFG